ncbi:CRM family member 2 [Wolffia australiana]
MLLPRPLHRLPPSSSSPGKARKPSFSPSPALHLLPPLRAAVSDTSTADRGATANSAIQRIAEKLRALGFIEEEPKDDEFRSGSCSAGEIFVPSPMALPKHRVGHTVDSSWSSPESPVPAPGSGPAFARFRQLRKQPPPPMEAEMILPSQQLRRLRSLGIRLDKKLRLKVGKAGVTEGIVNSIHERWRRSELVKIKCEDLCRMNMKRTHEILEKKTGGLVIWRSGSIIILYRGDDYKYPYFTHTESSSESESASDSESVHDEEETSLDSSSSSASTHHQLVHGVGAPNKVRFQMPGEVELGEEVDRLLDGLGPRFVDWWDPGPPPVDADLLPAVVHGYRRPFRLLPFGLHPKLTDREMTILRRLSRPLPCHFALGRNRNLQGLAQAMVKLWEKCEIAKIAVKRGARNTNSELMAEELKRLTGGTILSRDKDFIVFYRGKDFLPFAVSSAIEKRRKLESRSQIDVLNEASSTRMEINSEVQFSNDTMNYVRSEEVVSSSGNAVKLEAKLASALRKKEKAEKVLQELDESMEPPKSELDKEGISEEERFMLRKVGLRMKPFLLMGRRGVFDGTVENMHLHWKYRELVKIISKDRSAESVQRAAMELESASGGILVAIERVSKGFAIIIYRGKNYSRPGVLRPKNLLNKKEALRRSLESQRRQSLKLHVLKLSEDIDRMRHQMANDDSEFESSVAVSETSKHRFFEGRGEVEYATLEGNLDHESNTNSSFFAEDVEALSDVEQPTEQSTLAIDEPTLPEATTGKASGVKLSRKLDVLSNRERLILRKQALKMKKKPVFAIGRSNAIAGVARAIVGHFKKNPLAIVNVKGRAKGTSVQELVFALEQATGGLMVSREPSKIILYRGWPEQRQTRAMEDNREMREVEHGDVSPLLMAAISLECGVDLY